MNEYPFKVIKREDIDLLVCICLRDNHDEEGRKLGLLKLFVEVPITSDKIISKELIAKSDALIRMGYTEDSLKKLTHVDLNKEVYWCTFYNENNEEESGYIYNLKYE